MAGNGDRRPFSRKLKDASANLEQEAKKLGNKIRSTFTGGSLASTQAGGSTSTAGGTAATRPLPDSSAEELDAAWKQWGKGDLETLQDVSVGSFGKVSSAKLGDQGLKIAIKEPRQQVTLGSWVPVERVLRKESMFLDQLKQVPYVVHVVKYIDGYNPHGDPATPRLVMEYIEGDTLEKKIEKWFLGTEARPGLSAFLDIAEDIAACMASVHERIIFRGLRPAKLLLDLNGRVKLVGFGNAELASASQSGNQPGSSKIFTGAPQYLAPELEIKEDGSATYPYACDKSVDVYAFAVILWEVASGRFAYSDPATGPTASRPHLLRTEVHDDNRRPSPPVDARVFGDDVSTLIEACWHPQPQKRPPFVKIVAELKQIRART